MIMAKMTVMVIIMIMLVMMIMVEIMMMIGQRMLKITLHTHEGILDQMFLGSLHYLANILPYF